jgi:hypothetical protein
MINQHWPAEDILRVLLLALPLVVGGILHMVAVKRDILSYFKKPIHQRWFGQNKTWRGFLIMPLATWPGVWLAQWLEQRMDFIGQVISLRPSWLLALALGLGYCLAELPNSFLKRRLGVPEGKTANRGKWFFVVLDQADSVFGCLLAYQLFLPLSWQIFWVTVFFGTALHLLINVSLFQLGIRKNPY